MAALEFIFQNLWHFLGTLILILVCGESLASVVEACRR